MGVLILYFGHWLVPNFINSISWQGINGLIAQIILWTGWSIFVLGSVFVIPIYNVVVHRKEHRWLQSQK